MSPDPERSDYGGAYAGKKILVTGGLGFIGSNLVEALLRSGHDVRAVDDFSTGRRENLADVESWAAAGGAGFTLIEDDIRDREACRKAVSGVEHVFQSADL